jgi:hypothetical protein
MSQGDNIYDLVDIADANRVQSLLLSGPVNVHTHPDERGCVCRINCNRTMKRHLQYQKVHYIVPSYIIVCLI